MEQSEVIRQAASLLTVERSRHLPRPGRTWFIVVASAVGNLLVGANFESLAAAAPDAHYLLTFLLCESVFVCTYVSLLFFSEQMPILRRTWVFPLRPGSRILYLSWGCIRRPIFLLLLLTGSLVVAVMHRHAAGAMIGGALFLVALAVGLCVVLETAFLLCLRRGWPPSAAAAGLACVILVGAVVGVFAPQASLLSYVPMISWVSDGIMGAVHHRWASVTFNGVLFLGLFAVTYAIGKRYG